MKQKVINKKYDILKERTMEKAAEESKIEQMKRKSSLIKPGDNVYPELAKT